METSSKNHIGVWLDNRKAMVVSIASDGREKVIKIDSNVDESHPKGGSGSSIPYGKQDAISEQHYLERRKNQFKDFYTRIIQELENSDQFIVMGPAEAKIGFERQIAEQPDLHAKLASVETVDSYSENEIKAIIRSFFASKPEQR